MPRPTSAAETMTSVQKKNPVLRWWMVAAVLTASSSATAASSAGRSPVARIGWPFIEAGWSRPSARSAVGATSMSWAYGARPVLADVSQPVGEKPGPEAMPTCSCGRPSLTSEIPASSSRVSPGIVASAARS